MKILGMGRKLIRMFKGSPVKTARASLNQRCEQASYLRETKSGGLTVVKVKLVIDGDTVIVSESGREIKVRLDSIDCPEGGQPWGDIATAGLVKLIGGHYVYLEPHGHDRHGRTLATVYVMDGSELINVNERMVMLGHAWVEHMYYDHLSKGRRRQLNRLERWARSNRVGLWKTDNPIPPWLWRNRGSA